MLDAIAPLTGDNSGAVRADVKRLLRRIADGLPADRPERRRALALIQSVRSG